MSNIDKQALRERYSEKPTPKCHICGAVMTIQRAGAGGVVYGCTGRIDVDGEGYKFEDGRGFADDHYAKSRVTDYSPSGDPDVLALLNELEAMTTTAQLSLERVVELETALEEAKLQDQKIIMPKLPSLGADSEWYQGFAAGAEGMRNECLQALTAAGISANSISIQAE